jgi:hypothetical protein
MTDHPHSLEKDTPLPKAAQPDASPEADEADGELRLTVRKLEMPVRPRGVLAE